MRLDLDFLPLDLTHTLFGVSCRDKFFESGKLP